MIEYLHVLNDVLVGDCRGVHRGAGYLLLLHPALFPKAPLQGWQEGYEGRGPQVSTAFRISLQGKGTYRHFIGYPVAPDYSPQTLSIWLETLCHYDFVAKITWVRFLNSRYMKTADID